MNRNNEEHALWQHMDNRNTMPIYNPIIGTAQELTQYLHRNYKRELAKQ